MSKDTELLSRYAEDHSESAITELIQRYVDLVYSAALRLVSGDAHGAQDVTQQVFSELAQQAQLLSKHPALVGWLYTTTRRIALHTNRTEQRRKTREREAHVMTELLREPVAGEDWDPLRPVLEDAMHDLAEKDRLAVLLRYFQNKPLKEVGAVLGLNENAARMRVDRALDKLRAMLTQRGVTLSAAGLGAALAGNAVQAAPIGLAVTISTGAALAGTTLTTTATATATNAIAMTTLQKTLITATIVAAVGTGIYEAHQALTLRSQVQMLQQQQAPLAGQVEHLSQALTDANNQIATLREENQQLNRNTAELLQLRSEVASLHDESRQLAQGKTRDANDPTAIAAQAWLDRVKLLKQRFEQWPGKKTPALQLLNEQDWLNEAAKRELDSDAACREAMGHLRTTAKGRFATAVRDALEQFIISNNDQYPSAPSQLMPYLQPPADSILEVYEIAKPGSVHPPQPNSPGSERAETWALVEKGNFTPDGIPIRDGSNLADPDYDMYVVIYRGGYYMYGTGKPQK